MDLPRPSQLTGLTAASKASSSHFQRQSTSIKPICLQPIQLRLAISDVLALACSKVGFDSIAEVSLLSSPFPSRHHSRWLLGPAQHYLNTPDRPIQICKCRSS